MHYDQATWQMFYHKQLPSEQLDLMESHLATCNGCQELFLNSIDQDGLAATVLVGVDFSSHTMEFIKTSLHAQQRRPSARNKRRRMLINYVAAAAVTIVLMGGGVFQSAVDQTAQIPRQSNPIAAHNQEKSLLFTWPEKIEASATQWVDNMSFTKLKEVKW